MSKRTLELILQAFSIQLAFIPCNAIVDGPSSSIELTYSQTFTLAQNPSWTTLTGDYATIAASNLDFLPYQMTSSLTWTDCDTDDGWSDNKCQEVASALGLSLGNQDWCSTTEEYNPAEETRTYSSVFSDSCSVSMLDSTKGWCALTNDENQWMIIDAGSLVDVDAIIVQARNQEGGTDHYNYQRVTEFTLAYSSDSSTWTDFNSGVTLYTDLQQGDDAIRKYVSLSPSVEARYFKIMPKLWVDHITLRAGLQLAAVNCYDYMGDYNTKGCVTKDQLRWSNSVFYGTVDGNEITSYYDIVQNSAGTRIRPTGYPGTNTDQTSASAYANIFYNDGTSTYTETIHSYSRNTAVDSCSDREYTTTGSFDSTSYNFLNNYQLGDDYKVQLEVPGTPLEIADWTVNFSSLSTTLETLTVDIPLDSTLEFFRFFACINESSGVITTIGFIMKKSNNYFILPGAMDSTDATTCDPSIVNFSSTTVTMQIYYNKPNGENPTFDSIGITAGSQTHYFPDQETNPPGWTRYASGAISSVFDIATISGFTIGIIPDNGRANANTLQSFGFRLAGDYDTTQDACKPNIENFEMSVGYQTVRPLYKRHSGQTAAQDLALYLAACSTHLMTLEYGNPIGFSQSSSSSFNSPSWTTVDLGSHYTLDGNPSVGDQNADLPYLMYRLAYEESDGSSYQHIFFSTYVNWQPQTESMVLVTRDYPAGSTTSYQDQVNAGCYLYQIEGCSSSDTVSYIKMYYYGENCDDSEWGTNDGSGDCTETEENYDLYSEVASVLAVSEGNNNISSIEFRDSNGATLITIGKTNAAATASIASVGGTASDHTITTGNVVLGFYVVEDPATARLASFGLRSAPNDPCNPFLEGDYIQEYQDSGNPWKHDIDIFSEYSDLSTYQAYASWSDYESACPSARGITVSTPDSSGSQLSYTWSDGVLRPSWTDTGEFTLTFSWEDHGGATINEDFYVDIVTDDLTYTDVIGSTDATIIKDISRVYDWCTVKRIEACMHSTQGALGTFRLKFDEYYCSSIVRKRDGEQCSDGLDVQGNARLMEGYLNNDMIVGLRITYQSNEETDSLVTYTTHELSVGDVSGTPSTSDFIYGSIQGFQVGYTTDTDFTDNSFALKYKANDCMPRWDDITVKITDNELIWPLYQQGSSADFMSACGSQGFDYWTTGGDAQATGVAAEGTGVFEASIQFVVEGVYEMFVYWDHDGTEYGELSTIIITVVWGPSDALESYLPSDSNYQTDLAGATRQDTSALLNVLIEIKGTTCNQDVLHMVEFVFTDQEPSPTYEYVNWVNPAGQWDSDSQSCSSSSSTIQSHSIDSQVVYFDVYRNSDDEICGLKFITVSNPTGFEIGDTSGSVDTTQDSNGDYIVHQKQLEGDVYGFYMSDNVKAFGIRVYLEEECTPYIPWQNTVYATTWNSVYYYRTLKEYNDQAFDLTYEDSCQSYYGSAGLVTLSSTQETLISATEPVTTSDISLWSLLYEVESSATVTHTFQLTYQRISMVSTPTVTITVDVTWGAKDQQTDNTSFLTSGLTKTNHDIHLETCILDQIESCIDTDGYMKSLEFIFRSLTGDASDGCESTEVKWEIAGAACDIVTETITSGTVPTKFQLFKKNEQLSYFTLWPKQNGQFQQNPDFVYFHDAVKDDGSLTATSFDASEELIRGEIKGFWTKSDANGLHEFGLRIYEDLCMPLGFKIVEDGNEDVYGFALFPFFQDLSFEVAYDYDTDTDYNGVSFDYRTFCSDRELTPDYSGISSGLQYLQAVDADNNATTECATTGCWAGKFLTSGQKSLAYSYTTISGQSISEYWTYECEWPTVPGPGITVDNVDSSVQAKYHQTFTDNSYKLTEVQVCSNNIVWPDSDSVINKILFKSQNADGDIDIDYVIAKDTCDGQSRFIYQDAPCITDHCGTYIQTTRDDLWCDATYEQIDTGISDLEECASLCRNKYGCEFVLYNNDGSGQCLWSKTTSMTCPENLTDGTYTFAKLLFPLLDGEWYVTSNDDLESNFDTSTDELNHIIANYLTCEPDPDCIQFEYWTIEGETTHTTGFFDGSNLLSGLQLKTTEGVYNFGQTQQSSRMAELPVEGIVAGLGAIVSVAGITELSIKIDEDLCRPNLMTPIIAFVGVPTRKNMLFDQDSYESGCTSQGLTYTLPAGITQDGYDLVILSEEVGTLQYTVTFNDEYDISHTHTLEVVVYESAVDQTFIHPAFEVTPIVTKVGALFTDYVAEISIESQFPRYFQYETFQSYVTAADQIEFYSVNEYQDSLLTSNMGLCETDCSGIGCSGDLICKTRSDEDGSRGAPGCSLYQTSTSPTSSLCIDQTIYNMPAWVGAAETGNSFVFDIVLGSWTLTLNEQQDSKVPGIYWVTLETQFFNFDSTPVTTTYEVQMWPDQFTFVYIQPDNILLTVGYPPSIMTIGGFSVQPVQPDIDVLVDIEIIVSYQTSSGALEALPEFMNFDVNSMTFTFDTIESPYEDQYNIFVQAFVYYGAQRIYYSSADYVWTIDIFVPPVDSLVAGGLPPAWSYENNMITLDPKVSSALSWSINVLEYASDPDSDAGVFITFGALSAGASFLLDITEYTISIKISNTAELVTWGEENGGAADLSITLTDIAGDVTSVTLSFKIAEEEVESSSGSGDKSDEVAAFETDDFEFDASAHKQYAHQAIENISPPTAFITTLNNKGKISIFFTQEMDWPDDFEKIMNEKSRNTRISQGESPKRLLQDLVFGSHEEPWNLRPPEQIQEEVLVDPNELKCFGKPSKDEPPTWMLCPELVDHEQICDPDYESCPERVEGQEGQEPQEVTRVYEDGYSGTDVDEEIISVRVKYSYGSSTENTDFFWEALVPNQQQIDIQIYFKSAQEVSMHGDPDRIQIKFKDKQYFKDKVYGVEMEELSLIQDTPLPTQIPIDCASCDSMSAVGDSVQSTMLATGIISILTSTLMASSMNLLYGMLNMIQLYVHLPCFDLNFPGNVYSILSIFMNLAQMDLFTSEYTYSEILNYNPTVGMEEYGTRLPAVGYDSTSMIYNMGDTGIIQFWPFFMVLKLFFFRRMANKKVSQSYIYDNSKHRCKICCGADPAKQKEKYIKKKDDLTASLFYNWPLRFLLEFYLELCIASIIKYEARTYDFTTFCNFLDTVLGFFWLAVIILAPIIFMIFFWRNQEKLRNNKAFFQKFETAFEATKIDTFMQINYQGFFMMKRLLFVVSIFYFHGSAVYIQISIAIWIQLMYMVYVYKHKPFQNPKDAKMELFTELCTTLFVYNMFNFTEYIPTATIKFKLGWFNIFIFFFNMLISVGLVILEQVYGCIDASRRNIKIRNWCYKHGCMKRGKLDRVPIGYNGIDLLQIGHQGMYLKTKRELLMERFQKNQQKGWDLDLQDMINGEAKNDGEDNEDKMQGFKNAENMPACVSEISFHKGNIGSIKERPGEEDSNSNLSSWHLESSYESVESEHEQHYTLQRSQAKQKLLASSLIHPSSQRQTFASPQPPKPKVIHPATRLLDEISDDFFAPISLQKREEEGLQIRENVLLANKWSSQNQMFSELPSLRIDQLLNGPDSPVIKPLQLTKRDSGDNPTASQQINQKYKGELRVTTKRYKSPLDLM